MLYIDSIYASTASEARAGNIYHTNMLSCQKLFLYFEKGICLPALPVPLSFYLFHFTIPWFESPFLGRWKVCDMKCNRSAPADRVLRTTANFFPKNFHCFGPPPWPHSYSLQGWNPSSKRNVVWILAVAHYESMALAENTSVLRKAVLIFVEPSQSVVNLQRTSP